MLIRVYFANLKQDVKLILTLFSSGKDFFSLHVCMCVYMCVVASTCFISVCSHKFCIICIVCFFIQRKGKGGRERRSESAVGHDNHVQVRKPRSLFPPHGSQGQIQTVNLGEDTAHRAITHLVFLRGL